MTRGWSAILAPRSLVAWVAVLCLYVQLAAAASCAAGLIAHSGLDHGPIPICHAQMVSEDLGQTPKGGHAPSHQQSCPFCSIHCHASAMAAMPAIGIVKPVPVVVARTDTSPFRLPTSARFPAGAPPRGPPLAA